MSTTISGTKITFGDGTILESLIGNTSVGSHIVAVNTFVNTNNSSGATRIGSTLSNSCVSGSYLYVENGTPYYDSVSRTYLTQGTDAFTSLPRTIWGTYVKGLSTTGVSVINSGNTGLVTPGGTVTTLPGTWACLSLSPRGYSFYNSSQNLTYSYWPSVLFKRIA